MSEFPKKLYAVIDGETFLSIAENSEEEFNLGRSGYVESQKRSTRKTSVKEDVKEDADKEDHPIDSEE